MSANNRLTLGVHTLVWVLLHSQMSDKLATSEQIADSVNTNPVVIRRLLGQLKAGGLVESRRGVGAGWYLIQDPKNITLLDVYDAVEPGTLFAMHAAEPNQECVVGRGIQPALSRVYDRDSGRSQDIGRPDAAPRRRSPGLERSKSTAWATIYPASLGRRSSNTSLRSRTAANTSTQCRPNATQTIEVLWPLVGHRHNKEEY
jgi:DNA-binding IscR family transcriptional regulator